MNDIARLQTPPVSAQQRVICTVSEGALPGQMTVNVEKDNTLSWHVTVQVLLVALQASLERSMHEVYALGQSAQPQIQVPPGMFFFPPKT